MVRLVLDLFDDEAAVLSELRRLGVFSSEGDVIRSALWRHAEHFDIPMDPQTFAIGGTVNLFDAPHEACR